LRSDISVLRDRVVTVSTTFLSHFSSVSVLQAAVRLLFVLLRNATFASVVCKLQSLPKR